MTIRVVVFDLDDTLYDELDYVRSGLRVVATYLAERFSWPEDDLNRQLLQSLSVSRDNIFDRVLTQKGAWSDDLVATCVRVYREHLPSIRLSHQTKRLLKDCAKDYSIYVVTDGHAGVQQNKLDILGLSASPDIKACFATYALGQDYAKPSPKCFQLIAERENCAAQEIVYIADNASKDFVGIKPLGFQTIRVLTGQHSEQTPDVDHEAAYQAAGLAEALRIVRGL